MSFISFLVWLPWLGLPKLSWIKIGRVDILSHFWSYMKCSQIFTIEYDISCWFIIEGLYDIDIWSLCAHFVESFFLNYKWVLKFVRSCFWIYSDNHVLFIQFVDVVYPIDWFVEIWKNLCIPKVNSSWSLVYDPFNVAFVGFGYLIMQRKDLK